MTQRGINFHVLSITLIHLIYKTRLVICFAADEREVPDSKMCGASNAPRATLTANSDDPESISGSPFDDNDAPFRTACQISDIVARFACK